MDIYVYVCDGCGAQDIAGSMRLSSDLQAQGWMILNGVSKKGGYSGAIHLCPACQDTHFLVTIINRALHSAHESKEAATAVYVKREEVKIRDVVHAWLAKHAPEILARNAPVAPAPKKRSARKR